jgi:hypothetical protein
MWPGVPVVPALEPGASDAQFLNPAGIPTYGVTGLFTDPLYLRRSLDRLIPYSERHFVR